MTPRRDGWGVLVTLDTVTIQRTRTHAGQVNKSTTTPHDPESQSVNPYNIDFSNSVPIAGNDCLAAVTDYRFVGLF